MSNYSQDAWRIFKLKPWQLRVPFSKNNLPERGNAQHSPELQRWNQLKVEIAQCQICHCSLNRKKVVFGQGPFPANILIIGEAPSLEDNQTGEPFSGQNGNMLNAMLQAAGIEKKSCFITLAMKCKTEKPTEADIFSCRPFLMQQIQNIQPKVILLLGKTAALAVLEKKQDLKTLREQIFIVENTPTLVSFHPGHLFLKPEDKKWAWADLLRLKTLLAQNL